MSDFWALWEILLSLGAKIALLKQLSTNHVFYKARFRFEVIYHVFLAAQLQISSFQII